MKDTVYQKLQRLDAETQKIYADISMLPKDKLEDKSDGWSILQVFSHLNEAESISLQYMQKKMQAGDRMQKRSWGNLLRMWFVNRALQSSLRWKAPSYISNPPIFEYEEMKKKWAETREGIRAFIDEYPEEWMNKLVYKHPMGGRQDLSRAVDSFIYHQRHHVHQINRIRKKLGV